EDRKVRSDGFDHSLQNAELRALSVNFAHVRRKVQGIQSDDRDAHLFKGQMAAIRSKAINGPRFVELCAIHARFFEIGLPIDDWKDKREFAILPSASRQHEREVAGGKNFPAQVFQDRRINSIGLERENSSPRTGDSKANGGLSRIGPNVDQE